MNAKKVAEKIADFLFDFASSNGKQATRLVLEQKDEPLTGSGWGKRSVVDAIRRGILEGAREEKAKRRKLK